MKQAIIAVSCFCYAASSCNSNTTEKNSTNVADSSYTITGRITGIDSGKAYLYNLQTDEEISDSAIINNGIFVFKGKTPVPAFYILSFPNIGITKHRLGFFAENNQINISGKKDSIEDALITGSSVQEEYKNFTIGHKPIDEEGEKMEKKYAEAQAAKNKGLTDSLDKAFLLYDRKDKNFVKDYVKQHPSSYVSVMELYQKFSYNFDPLELDSIYNQLDTTIQQSFFGKKIKIASDLAKKTAIGNDAPDFAQNDVSGKPLSLSSFKGKYVLVDFWASWCGPCRAANPGIVKAYQLYHPKGLNILGVSLDQDKGSWTAAIKKDGLNWSQVSDLKGWDNSAAKLYGVKAIPMNFLLDKEGKIVAKNLSGEDLEIKLKEALK